MKVKEIMTKDLVWGTRDMTLDKIARQMVEHDIGAVPIVEGQDKLKIVGVVTDRDIATRAVAEGKNPLQVKAGDIMSSPVVTANQTDDIEEVTRLMEKHLVRRIPVVDSDGMLSGMVAQADIALKGSHKKTAEVVESISRPSEEDENKESDTKKKAKP